MAFAVPLLTMLEMHKMVGLRGFSLKDFKRLKSYIGLVLAPTYELASQLFREFTVLSNKIPNKLEIKLITKMNTKTACFKEQIQFIDILVFCFFNLSKSLIKIII